MWQFGETIYAFYVLALLLLAIVCFRFWVKTRFWFPRYVHYLAIISLILGAWVVWTTPEDAPINQEPWRDAKKLGIVFAMPAMVYFFFVFYGGQRAAYLRMQPEQTKQCPHCESANIPSASSHCPNCGKALTN